jgi:hypothetical protein
MALGYESYRNFFDNEAGDDMVFAEKRRLLEMFNKAMEQAHDKLHKYTDLSGDGQPAIKFLKAVRIFNPKRTPLMSHSLEDYSDIPGMDEVPREEFVKYTTTLAPDAIQNAAQDGPQQGEVDVDLFWKAVDEQVPQLAKVANQYKFAVTNSADAERSFSIYNLVLTSRRRSLSLKTIKAIVFLYYNKRVASLALGEIVDDLVEVPLPNIMDMLDQPDAYLNQLLDEEDEME